MMTTSKGRELVTEGSVVTSRPMLRGALHQWSLLVFVPLLAVMIGVTPRGSARMSMVIYAVGLVAMLAMSAAYHRGPWSPEARRIAQRFDHSAIFLAIAGSYTPVAVIALDGPLRIVLLLVAWCGALAGIVVRWVFRGAPLWAVATPYVVVGWVAVIAAPQLWDALGPGGFWLIVAGGVLYTLGAVVFATHRPDPWPATFGYHEVFHTCTIVAAGLHMAAIAFYVIPLA
jgi:hemolysin III